MSASYGVEQGLPIADRAAALAVAAGDAAAQVAAAQARVDDLTGRAQSALVAGDVPTHDDLAGQVHAARAQLSAASDRLARIRAAEVQVASELRDEQWASQLETARDLLASDRAALDAAAAQVLADAEAFAGRVRALRSVEAAVNDGAMRVYELTRDLNPGGDLPSPQPVHVVDVLLGRAPWLRDVVAWSSVG